MLTLLVVVVLWVVFVKTIQTYSPWLITKIFAMINSGPKAKKVRRENLEKEKDLTLPRKLKLYNFYHDEISLGKNEQTNSDILKHSQVDDTFNFLGHFVFGPRLAAISTKVQCELVDQYCRNPPVTKFCHIYSGVFDSLNFPDGKKNSRYYLQVDVDVFNLEGPEAIQSQYAEFFRCITTFNDAFDYVSQKTLLPTNFAKYNNCGVPKSRIGVFNANCYSKIRTVQDSLNVMQNIGEHYCSFDRYDTSIQSKFCNKTKSSVEKLMGLLLRIVRNFYDEQVHDNIVEYLGSTEANDSHRIYNKFTIKFIEGFFGEGKTTILKEKKEDSVCWEFLDFIRCETLIENCSVLTSKSISNEDKYKFNRFINGAATTLNCLRIFNMVRTNKVSAAGEITIDRGCFSRIHFKYTETSNHREILQDFYSPLCLFYDMIQCNFQNDELIQVRFCHEFWVNTMKDNMYDWRKNKDRDLERILYPTVEEEKRVRKEVYKKIYFMMPSLINTLTNNVIMIHPEKKIFDVVMIYRDEYTNFNKLDLQDNYNILISDFISEKSFEAFLDKLFHVNLIDFSVKL